MAASNEEPSSHLVLFLQYSTVQYDVKNVTEKGREGKGREEGKGTSRTFNRDLQPHG